MGKHKHLKVKRFLKLLYEVEIHTVPKTQEKWISIAREKHGEINFMGFLNISGEAEIHTIPKICKK